MCATPKAEDVRILTPVRLHDCHTQADLAAEGAQPASILSRGEEPREACSFEYTWLTTPHTAQYCLCHSSLFRESRVRKLAVVDLFGPKCEIDLT